MAAGRQDESTEAALIRRAQGGDEEAFAQLVAEHRRAVYRAAYAALGSAADADDAAQETFVAVHRTLGAFRGESAFRTWVLAIAWRKALDRRRHLRRWLRFSARADWQEDASAIGDRVTAPGPSQEDGTAARELQHTLRRLIVTLPRRHRDALLLAASGEYSYDQIAAMLRIPTGTLKWRVSEARRILRAKLAAVGYDHA